MKKTILITALSAFVLFGCGTTAQIQSSWKDPEAVVDMNKLNKVLVIALLKNDSYRRAAESQLVGLLNNKGVASFNYGGPDLVKMNEMALKKHLIAQGFDGAVILRLADVDKDITYVPGNAATYPTYYGRFGPYFRTSWGYYTQPGYFETTKTFTIETNVYSLRKDKLVWSSLTSSSYPENADQMMRAVGKEVYKKMKKEGFIIN